MNPKYVDNTSFDFILNNENRVIVSENEKIIFKTLDCFSNKLIPFGSKMGVDTLNRSNPITGPVYVDGTHLTDSIAVFIEKIELGKIGIACVSPDYILLSEELLAPEIKRVKITDSSCELLEGKQFPIVPSIGTIGVVPEASIGSCHTGNHGGNMDCSNIRTGSIVILPVYNEGAYLYIGDLHGAIGDGEMAECGLEVEGEVTAKIKVLKNFNINMPIIINEDRISIVSTGKSIELAIKHGLYKMLKIICQAYGIEEEDGIHILNLYTNVRMCQIAGVEKVVRIECLLNEVTMYIGQKIVG